MTRREDDAVGRARRRPVVAVVAGLLALGAWVALLLHLVSVSTHAHGTHGHDDVAVLLRPGVPEAVALAEGPPGIALYLAMWATMMVAMMFPVSAYVFQLYADDLVDDPRGRRLAGIVAFVGTYTLVWSATGLIPLGFNALVPIVDLAARGWGFFGAALLINVIIMLSK